jgi:hypothetical protein
MATLGDLQAKIAKLQVQAVAIAKNQSSRGCEPCGASNEICAS